MPYRMPSQMLPQSVDALKLCQQRARVAGYVPVSVLPRLSGQLQSGEGEVEAELVFGVDEQSRKTVAGKIQAVLSMQCQRCLERVEIPVTATLSLALVWTDEQAAQLPRQLDPVLMESQQLDLHSIVEEELLLALPLVATHSEGSCEPPGSGIANPALDETAVGRKENPFQVLAALKSAGKRDD